jgi:hypothetical protein
VTLFKGVDKIYTRLRISLQDLQVKTPHRVPIASISFMPVKEKKPGKFRAS